MTILSRRAFIGSLGAGALGGAYSLAAAPENRKPTPRRLLFNWDGSMIHCFGRAALGNPDGPLTREQFTSLMFTPLDERAVDAVLFSFGSGNVAEYQSDVLEWPGEADRFVFPKEKTWHGGMAVDPADQYHNPKSLAGAGQNPPAIVVDECHKRGIDAFVSLRMNDCHDGQHAKGTLPNVELATFKRQNPDWLVPDLDWWTALNYAHPRVRKLKLRVVEEFFDRWNFDGIELDWLRHSLHFPRGTEQENAHHLTGFMRTVRQSLNARAKRRGRPIEIAVRIPERLSWCKQGGFDVPTWLSEDLCDMLILGQGLTQLPTLGEFHDAMSNRRIPIYPCLATYGNGYSISPESVVRGSADNLWHDGADGLYTFNWFFHGDWRKQLLGDISEPSRLVGKNKRYTLTHRVKAAPGEPGADYVRYNTQGKDAPLPFNLTVDARAKTVSIAVGPDAGSEVKPPSRAALVIAADFLGESDVLELALNGHRLERPGSEQPLVQQELGQPLDIPAGNGLLGFSQQKSVDNSFSGLSFIVPVERLRPGNNELTFRLKQRTPGFEHSLRVTRVELEIVAE